MATDALKQAIEQELAAGSNDQTRGIRVRKGVYSLRNKPGFYMVRIRIPAGVITPDQLDVIASLATETGWPAGAHLTTRQGIEIIGVPAVKVLDFIQRVENAGLTTSFTGGNVVRGVVANPLSGVERDEYFDVTPYALAIDEYYRLSTAFQQMPRKIKISLESSSREDYVRTLVSDIGLKAALRNGERGFHVVIGGGLGAAPKSAQILSEFVPVEELITTIDAILTVFNQYGNRENRSRARLKWLIEEKGIEWFRGEFEKAFSALGKIESPTWHAVSESSPLFVSSGKEDPEGESYHLWKGSNVMAQKQNELVSVYVRVPNGDLLPKQFNQVANISRKYAGGIRTSIDQNLLLRHVNEEALPELYQALQEAGLSACCAGELIDVTRCAGSDVCLSAITNSRGAAGNISEAIKGDFSRDPELRRLRIRISGCPNSCSHHNAADIGLFGVSKRVNNQPVPHYAVLLGGSSHGGDAGIRVAEIPAIQIGKAVKTTLELYRKTKQSGESFASFVKRVGQEALHSHLAPLAEVPPSDVAPEYYRDLESSEGFRVAVGKGECAA